MKVFCNPLQASQCTIGQWVEVEVPARLVIQASMLAYILPLLAMFLLAITFEQLFGGELAAIFGAGAGLLSGFYLARQFGERLSNNPQLQPRLTRLISG